MQYQIQEMLRIERIFEATGIEEELDAYNALIPDGTNFKATFMIEYEDEDERKKALEKLIGIEDKVWVQVSGFDKVFFHDHFFDKVLFCENLGCRKQTGQNHSQCQ